MALKGTLKTSTRITISVILAAFLVALVPASHPAAALLRSSVKTIHVAANDPLASDTNAGSAQRPLLTINEGVRRALAAGRKGVAADVIVHGGTYREAITIASDGAGPPLRLIGVDDPVVSGAKVWKGWRRSGNSNVFSRRWPFRWGLNPIPAEWTGAIRKYLRRHPLIRRSEMLFARGRALQQVARMRQLRAAAGTFLVDERRRKVFVHLNDDAASGEPAIEVAVNPRLLLIAGKDDVTVQGFTFRHSSTPLNGGGAVAATDASRLTMLNNRFVWNNHLGMSFSGGEDILMRGNVANYNGVGGIGGARSKRVVMIDNETSYNNWRGSIGSRRGGLVLDPDFTDFSGGQKFLRLHTALFLRHRAVGNLSGGLWFDFDNTDITVRDSTLVDNRTHGIFIEANQGPFSVTGNQICGNESGVLISNTKDGMLANNVLVGNSFSQIFLLGRSEPRYVNDWETGEEMYVKSENWVVRGNVVGVSREQKAISTYLPEDRWMDFVTTLNSGTNIWGTEDRKDVFEISGGRDLEFAEWQEYSGQDRDSLGATPTVDTCHVPEP